MGVFPTHVGVFLAEVPLPTPTDSLPHARGGVSLLILQASCPFSSSPRTWGCFSSSTLRRIRLSVFPTHVGGVPQFWFCHHPALGLPHACGGVSIYGQCRVFPDLSSPRMWGCFHRYGRLYLIHRVFPTHVGVFPGCSALDSSGRGLPHACGGVSGAHLRSCWPSASSPRMWGVSMITSYQSGRYLSSPRMWGLALSGILVLE